jgi:hypothetical protein
MRCTSPFATNRREQTPSVISGSSPAPVSLPTGQTSIPNRVEGALAVLRHHRFKMTKTLRTGRADAQTRRTCWHSSMPIPMPEQNAEMHREFHGRFGTRCNRFCRQVRPAFQHPLPISGCSLPSPKIACLSPYRSRRKRVSMHRRRAPLCRKHVPRTVIVPEENDGQTSVHPCLADAHVAPSIRSCATELDYAYRHDSRRAKPFADQRSQALLAGTHFALL